MNELFQPTAQNNEAAKPQEKSLLIKLLKGIKKSFSRGERRLVTNETDQHSQPLEADGPENDTDLTKLTKDRVESLLKNNGVHNDNIDNILRIVELHQGMRKPYYLNNDVFQITGDKTLDEMRRGQLQSPSIRPITPVDQTPPPARNWKTDPQTLTMRDLNN